MPISPATADLCDAYDLEVADPIFRDFGRRRAFSGRIETVRVHDDNVLVKRRLEERGDGVVLVIDGGGSLRCALLGDRLATLARDHGFAGVVIHGAVRDSAALADIDLGIKALATCPRRSHKEGRGERDIAVAFAGVTFVPGHHLYADGDGIVIAAQPLER